VRLRILVIGVAILIFTPLVLLNETFMKTLGIYTGYILIGLYFIAMVLILMGCFG